MDRNRYGNYNCMYRTMSLSARRAWIEINNTLSLSCVDLTSLSARRAWIEILEGVLTNGTLTVALRKESVDRNFALRVYGLNVLCRSPQGERG